MVKLSQCMIVKNEEENIEKALSWAKGIAYEQIVVDTGSTDRTVEIAKSMGAKVYHFEWVDDFSAAKNYAISKATGDWIAFLDADEYFNEEDAKKLVDYLEEIQNSKYLSIITAWLQLDDNGKIFSDIVQMRIFRNMKGLQYFGAIHETLRLNGEDILIFSLDAREDLTIFHTGYTKESLDNKNKCERNIQILLKEIEKYPENRDFMGYLGDAYFALDDYVEAKKWFEKAVESLEHPSKDMLRKYNNRIPTSFSKLMNVLYNLREFDRLLEVYEQAVRVVPEESDFDYFMVYYWMIQKENYEKALLHLELAFQKLEFNRDSFYGITLKGQLQKAWELRAACYYNLQNWSKCIENCVVLLREDKYRYTTTTMLLSVFQMDEARGGASAGAVLQFLANLYSLQSLKDRMYLLKVATDIYYESMIQELRKLFTPEELAVLDSSRESK